MSLHGLYPFAGSHAIQSALFALEWLDPLTPSQVISIRAAVEPLKSEFPAAQDQQLVMVNLGLAGRQIQTEQLGGFTLSRDSTLLSGPSRVITLSRESLHLNIADYTRWARVKSDVFRYLQTFLPAINKQINSIALQYNDVFVWRDEPAKLPVQAIFKPGSKFLVSNARTLTNLWHSHHGYFTEFAEPRKCLQLDNINVSRTVNAGTHSIQVLTSHRAQLESALWLGADSEAVLDQTFERMHATNKDMLRELLSDEVQDLIKLNKPETKNAV